MSTAFYRAGHGKVSVAERRRIEKALHKADLDEVTFANPKMPEGWRWWFEGSNQGDPFDRQMGNAVAEAVHHVRTTEESFIELQ